MKVAVVGGGVMGLAAARALARRGEEVTVYEQFELGHTRGSSHGESRIFRLSYPEDEWMALARHAYGLWRALERETGRTILRLNGLLDVEEDPTARLATFERNGVECELLDPAAVERRFGVRVEVPSVFSPDAGITLAREAREAFVESARAAGAEIRERAPVAAVVDVDADIVVVTAGGWAPRLLAEAGVPLAARPTRETVAYFRLREDRVVPSVIDELGDGEGHVIYALEAPGVGLKVGVHQAGPDTDPDETGAPDARLVSATAEWVARRFPFVDPEPFSPEACIYTRTADDSFVLERHGRIVVGSACSGHGFKFAPAVGELLADLV